MAAWLLLSAERVGAQNRGGTEVTNSMPKGRRFQPGQSGTPANARVAAASALLDRGFGRPAGDVEDRSETVGSQVAHLLAELERQRKARAQEEEKARTQGQEQAELRQTAH